MILIYQCLWAVLGLFFGLLLVSPHHVIPTRSCSAKSICLLVIFSSLVGMLGFFQTAFFLIACAIVVLMKLVISKLMVAVNTHKPVTECTEHKALEHKS